MSKNYEYIKVKKIIRKEGFTLIEMLAVIAIILVLASVMFPNVAGYINEGKKIKVVDQCRKVVMASESYNLRYSELEKSDTVSSLLSHSGISEYVNEDDLKNININSTTLQNCYDIIEGESFSLIKNNDGIMILDNNSIGKSANIEVNHELKGKNDKDN